MAELDETISRLREQIYLGELQAAQWSLQKLFKRYPTNPDVIATVAYFQSSSGATADAIQLLRQTLKQNPNSATLHEELGFALARGGDDRAAQACYRRALEIEPSRETVLNLLYVSIGNSQQWEEFAEFSRWRIARVADDPVAWNNLGAALTAMGQYAEAVHAYRQALKFKPDYLSASSNIAMNSNYRPDVTPQQVADVHREWNDLHGFKQPLDPNRFAAIDRSPNRRLRIGYVSGDFREHAVNSFFEPILTHHDKQHFEVICFSSGETDDVTSRLKAHASGWHDISKTNDDAASQLVFDNRIDILIDLAGHTDRNRLAVFARQPAPIQFTYLGYPNTTGLPAIQYRLTDAVADPPGMTDPYYAEQLVRMPNCFLCYQPNPSAPEPLTETPARAAGQITFGSFNGFVKLTDEMMGAWAEILKAVPNSRLLIKTRVMELPSVQKRVRKLFTDSGVAENRVGLMNWVEPKSRHSIVATTDIALDSFPYHGTTTTCEVVWMAVPWITLAGNNHASRVSASILTAVGAPELIAATREEYIAKAVALAGDLDRLDTYRRTLRDKMRASSLLDAPRFAKNLESIYREKWKHWLTTSAS